MPGCHVLSHDLAWNDVVCWTIGRCAEPHEDIEMVLWREDFRLIGQNPAFGRASGSLALDSDGFLRFEVCSKDIYPWRVTHRNRSDEAPAGEFPRDEVFTGDTCKLGAGFHCLSLIGVTSYSAL